MTKQIASIAFAAVILAAPVAQAGFDEAAKTTSNEEMKTNKEPKKMFDKVMKPRSGIEKNEQMFDKVMKPGSTITTKGRK